MSAIPAGAVPITFAVDKTLVNQYLAELRQGFTVPVRPTFTGGAASAGEGPIGSLGGGGSNGNGLAASGGRGGASEADREAQRAERERAARIRRVDSAWDRASLAEQKAAERAEREAQSGGSGGGGRGFGGMVDTRLRRAMVGIATMEGLRLAQQAEQYQSGMALARTGMDRMQVELGLANAVSSVPIVGQVAALVTSPWRFAANAASMGANESILDVAARAQADARSRRTGLQADTLRDEASRIGIRSSVTRDVQGVLDSEVAAGRQESTELADLREQMSIEQDPAQRNRLTLQYNRIVRDSPGLAKARLELGNAKIEDIRRNYRLTLNAEQRRELELTAASQGRFGEAAEDAFQRDLQDRVAQAKLVSPEYAATVGHNNLLAIRARTAETALASRGIQDQANAIAFEVFRDPLNAQLTRIANERRAAMANARPGQEGAIGNRYDNEATLARQQYADANQHNRYAIGARNEQLGILGDFTTDPATRELRSQVDGIRRRTQMEALGVFQRDANEGRAEAPGIFRGGQLELQALQQRYLSSFRAEEVNPNRTALSGSGTEDPTALLKSIDDTIKELKKVPQSLDDIKAALQSALVAQ